MSLYCFSVDYVQLLDRLTVTSCSYIAVYPHTARDIFNSLVIFHMPNAIPPDRYTRYPLLNAAIAAHRRARIAHAAAPSSATAAHVKHARSAERKARSEHAAVIREDKIAAQNAAIRRQRYHYQHSRKSRTSDPAADLHGTRAERRAAAALAHQRKRDANAINSVFSVPD